MSIVNKVAPAEYRLKSDEHGQPTGEVEALVAVFGNVDRDGERILPGAFTKSLEAWRQSGDPIPMVFAHDWKNPLAYYGAWDPHKSHEVPPSGAHGGGLLLKGTIDINQGNPVADQIYRLLKTRRIKEHSFASLVKKEARASDFANELSVVDIVEAGACMKGVNSETELLTVKAIMPDDWKVEEEELPTAEDFSSAYAAKAMQARKRRMDEITDRLLRVELEAVALKHYGPKFNVHYNHPHMLKGKPSAGPIHPRPNDPRTPGKGKEQTAPVTAAPAAPAKVYQSSGIGGTTSTGKSTTSTGSGSPLISNPIAAGAETDAMTGRTQVTDAIRNGTLADTGIKELHERVRAGEVDADAYDDLLAAVKDRIQRRSTTALQEFYSDLLALQTHVTPKSVGADDPAYRLAVLRLEQLGVKHFGPGVGPHYNHPHDLNGKPSAGPTSPGGGTGKKLGDLMGQVDASKVKPSAKLSNGQVIKPGSRYESGPSFVGGAPNIFVVDTVFEATSADGSKYMRFEAHNEDPDASKYHESGIVGNLDKLLDDAPVDNPAKAGTDLPKPQDRKGGHYADKRHQLEYLKRKKKTSDSFIADDIGADPQMQANAIQGAQDILDDPNTSSKEVKFAREVIEKLTANARAQKTDKMGYPFAKTDGSNYDKFAPDTIEFKGKDGKTYTGQFTGGSDKYASVGLKDGRVVDVPRGEVKWLNDNLEDFELRMAVHEFYEKDPAYRKGPRKFGKDQGLGTDLFTIQNGDTLTISMPDPMDVEGRRTYTVSMEDAKKGKFPPFEKGTVAPDKVPNQAKTPKVSPDKFAQVASDLNRKIGDNEFLEFDDPEWQKLRATYIRETNDPSPDSDSRDRFMAAVQQMEETQLGGMPEGASLDEFNEPKLYDGSPNPYFQDSPTTPAKRAAAPIAAPPGDLTKFTSDAALKDELDRMIFEDETLDGDSPEFQYLWKRLRNEPSMDNGLGAAITQMAETQVTGDSPYNSDNEEKWFGKGGFESDPGVGKLVQPERPASLEEGYTASYSKNGMTLWTKNNGRAYVYGADGKLVKADFSKDKLRTLMDEDDSKPFFQKGYLENLSDEDLADLEVGAQDKDEKAAITAELQSRGLGTQQDYADVMQKLTKEPKAVGQTIILADAVSMADKDQWRKVVSYNGDKVTLMKPDGSKETVDKSALDGSTKMNIGTHNEASMYENASGKSKPKVSIAVGDRVVGRRGEVLTVEKVQGGRVTLRSEDTRMGLTISEDEYADMTVYGQETDTAQNVLEDLADEASYGSNGGSYTPKEFVDKWSENVPRKDLLKIVQDARKADPDDPYLENVESNLEFQADVELNRPGRPIAEDDEQALYDDLEDVLGAYNGDVKDLDDFVNNWSNFAEGDAPLFDALDEYMKVHDVDDSTAALENILRKRQTDIAKLEADMDFTNLSYMADNTRLPLETRMEADAALARMNAKKKGEMDKATAAIDPGEFGFTPKEAKDLESNYADGKGWYDVLDSIGPDDKDKLEGMIALEKAKMAARNKTPGKDMNNRLSAAQKKLGAMGTTDLSKTPSLPLPSWTGKTSGTVDVPMGRKGGASAAGRKDVQFTAREGSQHVDAQLVVDNQVYNKAKDGKWRLTYFKGYPGTTGASKGSKDNIFGDAPLKSDAPGNVVSDRTKNWLDDLHDAFLKRLRSGEGSTGKKAFEDALFKLAMLSLD